MPLPPALLERLAKRGIVDNQKKEKTGILKKKQVETEEVIAESYDEPNESQETKSDSENTKPAKKFQPHPVMEKRRLRMLKIYPLPPNWVEVPDPDTNRYYYWNTETNQVCWISPAHPKAKIEFPKKGSASESTVKSSIKEVKVLDSNNKSDESSSYRPERSKQNKKSRQKDELDPMDPSAYSDIPRGKWSDGLEGASR